MAKGKNDQKLIVFAAAQAGKAAEYILGTQANENSPTEENEEVAA